MRAAFALKSKLSALPVAIVAAATMLAGAPHTAAAAKPVIEVPEVKSAAETITRHGQPKLLVKSLTIFHAHEVDVRATCHHCLRLPGPKSRRLEPARGITRFAGLNWILDEGLHVRVYVTAAGAIGRYAVLGPEKPLSRHRLVVESNGCLNEGEQPVNCPEESPTSISPPTTTYRETAGGNTETWADYTNAGAPGGSLIYDGQTVEVSCAVRGFKVADGNTWWYRIASSPWNNAYYASADPFYNNGQTSGSLIGTPLVDPQVPACGN